MRNAPSIKIHSNLRSGTLVIKLSGSWHRNSDIPHTKEGKICRASPKKTSHFPTCCWHVWDINFGEIFAGARGVPSKVGSRILKKEERLRMSSSKAWREHSSVVMDDCGAAKASIIVLNQFAGPISRILLIGYSRRVSIKNRAVFHEILGIRRCSPISFIDWR